MHVVFILVPCALAIVIAVLLYALVRESRQSRSLAAEVDRLLEQITAQDRALHEHHQRNALKDEFISTVSHELRTPLTSIRGALGLLNGGHMGQLDDKASNLLRIASTNTDRLMRLINDILDLERMNSGRAPMQLRACSLRDLLRQSVDTMTSMADDAGVQFVILPEPPGMPATFLGDPDRMQQVLVNLLSNAIKFSPRETLIRFRSSFDNDALYLRVEDEGRGVPADMLESIFERFHQVESDDARQKGGTGLGLAISRTILAQHNGRIWAERNDANTPGAAGTTLIIRLPRSE